MVHTQITDLQEDLATRENPLTEEIWKKIRRYTMTDRKRVNGLINAIEYTLEKGIPGDFVECGVWKGGNIMTMILVLQKHNEKRRIWLYDTFEGMSEPTEEDVHRGKDAQSMMDKNPFIKCIAPIDAVRKAVGSLNYEGELVYVKGKVEDTIPEMMPKTIGLLRLDTDWYESTAHELKHLYPLLKEEGVMIVDDYNFWDGSTKAVNEYFTEGKNLSRLSTCGVLTIK
jgi:hypothetical protein